MQLKPQDILVLLKLIAIGRSHWSYNTLAVALGMSPSEVHSAVKRLISAELMRDSQDVPVPVIGNLEEFLVHGLKYAFIPERGSLTRGIPTGYAAPPLARHFSQSDDPPPVWPDPNGKVRGQGFSPLYRSVPIAIQTDPQLYELLALVDAIRDGRARERAMAIEELKARLKSYDATA